MRTSRRIITVRRQRIRFVRDDSLLALSNSEEIYGNDDSVDYRRITDAFPVRPGPALLCPTLHGKGASSEGHSNTKDRDAHGMGGTVSHGLGRFID